MRAHGVSAIGLLCAFGVLLPGSGTGTATTARTVLPWIADDYTKAVAEARARKVPIFIESWAPW